MRQEIEAAIAAAVKQLFDVQSDIELTRPEEQFGDYSTNVALQLAAKTNKNPREIAEALAAKLGENLSGQVSKIDVAGPGFLNLTLSDKALRDQLKAELPKQLAGQEILVEFGDPNPFKEMHIGHLYSYVVGDALCSLLESAGASVKRLSYHGDVGLHVAKAIWGMQQADSDVGSAYAKGAAAYEDSETARKEIDKLNTKIYAGDPSIKQLYEQGKTQSFANFDEILKGLHIKTDKRYFESQTAPVGVEMVKQNLGKVFTESDGAVVYEGEKIGLHTRVFITGKGLPTYETKDLGLTELKNRDYPEAAGSIIITANEQNEYFKVMLAALAEINPGLAKKTKHLSHGFVSLSTGKMSSRTGDVYSAEDLLAGVKQSVEKLYPDAGRDIQLGAIKYAFTKHRLGGDLVYDVTESVSLEGNSGPYLQYAHARACSILSKAEADAGGEITDLEAGERSLARKIGEYAEVVDKAVNELMPHHVCTYLYELAQTFNRFYEQNRVIGDPREQMRLQLVKNYAETLKNGLELLGITAPQKM